MKKILCAFLCMLIIVCFIGCENNQAELTPSPTVDSNVSFSQVQGTFKTIIKEDTNFTIYTSEEYSADFYKIYDNKGHLLDEGFHPWRGSLDITKSDNIVTLEYGLGGNSTPRYRFYDVENGKVSRFFDGPIKTKDNLIACFDTRDSVTYLTVQDIFDADAYYCEFTGNFDVHIYLSCTEIVFLENAITIKYSDTDNYQKDIVETFKLK